MTNRTPISRWRNYKQIYTLTGCQCVACGKKYYPKKHLCVCGSRELEAYEFSGDGTLVTFTQVMHAPELFKEYAPYCIGIVELEDRVRVFARLVDVELDELSIGMPVRAVFRKLHEEGKRGTISYGVTFTKK